jgi:hypothetical protein
MMEPENRVECRYLRDAHVAHSEGVVYIVMQRLEITDLPSAGTIAPFVERLVDGEQFVQCAFIVWLRSAELNIDFVVSASGVG